VNEYIEMSVGAAANSQQMLLIRNGSACISSSWYNDVNANWQTLWRNVVNPNTVCKLLKRKKEPRIQCHRIASRHSASFDQNNRSFVHFTGLWFGQLVPV